MDIDQKIFRLEERLTWLERHIAEQDRVVSAQSFEIESLKTNLATLHKQLRDNAPPGQTPPGEERPPHY